MTPEILPNVDKVMPVSDWHKTYLEMCYPFLKDKLGVLHNGVNLERFDLSPKVEIIPYRCFYSASPERGLLDLLRLWPRLRTIEPAAELHIFYGWETLDRAIAQGYTHLAVLKATILNLLEHTQGVVWRGRVSQKELAREMLQCDLWTYPTFFLEVFNITAVEAMAARAIPVTSHLGAIPEVVGDAGLLIRGDSRSHQYQVMYEDAFAQAQADVETRGILRRKMAERVQMWTWDKVYEVCWASRLKALVTA